MNDNFTPPILFEYFALLLWAISGAIVGWRKGYDVVGVFVIAFVSSFGGGLLRDGLFLQRLPVVLTDSNYIFILIATVSGIGGGLMRDLMAGDTPELLRPGQYNTLLVILAALFYLLVTQYSPLTRIETAWLTIGLFFAARLLTIRFNWRTRPLHDFHVSEVMGGVAEWMPWGKHK